MFTVSCIEKTKIKQKEAGIGPFFKKKIADANNEYSSNKGTAIRQSSTRY